MSRDGGFDSSVGDGIALRAPGATPWRALVAVVFLSLALTVVLYESLTGGRSPVAHAPSFRASSHLHPRASSHRQGLSSLPAAAQGPAWAVRPRPSIR